jgi:hypothetical protein
VIASLQMRLVPLALLIAAPPAFLGQTVTTRDGNVLFKAKDGSAIQITSSGLDSDPGLSANKKLVVFVRRTPSFKIWTALEETDRNEIWVASISAEPEPRRVLVGHGSVNGGRDLAGFSSPQFSLDAKRVYFIAELAATGNSVRALDLATGKVDFLYRGESVEVIQSGSYAGYLIGLKAIPHAFPPPHVFRYWLLDQHGKDVAEIGEESDVKIFKSGRF